MSTIDQGTGLPTKGTLCATLVTTHNLSNQSNLKICWCFLNKGMPLVEVLKKYLKRKYTARKMLQWTKVVKTRLKKLNCR